VGGGSVSRQKATDIGTTDDGNNISGYSQSGSQNPNSQPPAASEEHHCPKPGYETPKPKKANKHWLEYVTAGFALVAALGSISAAVIGCWQWSVMKGQLDVMRDQNRPWIRAQITFARPLIFTDWAKQKALFVSLKFDLKNFGDIPARNIRISTFVSAHPGTAKKQQLDDWEAAACKNAREMADSDKIGGVASFPNLCRSCSQSWCCSYSTDLLLWRIRKPSSVFKIVLWNSG
jgi:hypothetical protein